MRKNPFVMVEKVDFFEGNSLGINSKSKEDIINGINVIINDVTNPDTPIDKKMDYVIKLNGFLASIAFRELLEDLPSDKLMKGTSRISSIIKEISSLVVGQYRLLESYEINPSSKKFQVAFIWFLQSFREVLEYFKLDVLTIDSIFNELSIRLSGWEETLTTRLKGLSPWAIDEEMLKNPFKARK
jgi:hypothetical protein